MYFFNGGGVGIGDINNDGLADVFLSGNMESSRLYLNRGNLKFEDITAKARITTNGWCTGVTMADVNHDGFLDLYVSRAGSPRGGDRANLLFLNNRDNTFSEIASLCGVADTAYSTQAAFLDYDRDGDLDLYLLNHDHAPRIVNNPVPIKTHGESRNNDKLYRNLGNNARGHPMFEDVSKQAGIQTEGYGLGVAVSDLNDDGWPDIYVSNDFLSVDILYINNQDGTFSNKIDEMLRHQSYNGMGVDVADYNNDGLQDIVVMDMLPPDNRRQKTMLGGMTNEKFDFLLSMGYAPQYMRNTLQLNRGGSRFSEIGQLAGIDKTDWSWSPLFADFDNDGWKDLFISNGYYKDITDKDFINFTSTSTMFKGAEESDATLLELMDKQPGVRIPNYIFRNNRDLTFTHEKDWGIDQPSFSNGASFGDLDNDGDLDLVVNNINEPAFLYENKLIHGDQGHYLQVVLEGDTLNQMGIGARITAYNNGHLQRHDAYPVRGFQSTIENVAHFGLGNAVNVDSIQVVWPGGDRQVVINVKVDQRITIYRSPKSNEPEIEFDPKSELHGGEQKRSAQLGAGSAASLSHALFADVTGSSNINLAQKARDFSDLASDPLLPLSHVGDGPSIAVGDVDRNGLDDFIVGESSGSEPTIFYQDVPGEFRKVAMASAVGSDSKTASVPVSKTLSRAQTGTTTAYGPKTGGSSLLFDADQDGDLDLYVACGYNGMEDDGDSSKHSIYRNDGRGHFVYDRNALPSIQTIGSVVTAADFDKDGDLDLFVGGRVVADSYPASPRSYVLQNNNGRFTDVTQSVCASLVAPGMVTTALWTDFNTDGNVDLMIAGEWMPIRFFQNENGKLIETTQQTDLPTTTGLWNSISGGDFDNDGDIDYLLGNLGRNTPFTESEKGSVALYSGDFDESGRSHAVLSWYNGVAEYPWHSKDILLKQMPRLGKRYLKYADYANATMDDLMPGKVRANGNIVRATILASSYVENKGKGKFTITPLPLLAQVSSVKGILVCDINDDDYLDAVVAGNEYGFDVSIGRADASWGLCLLGNGTGTFNTVASGEAGFIFGGDGGALSRISAGSMGMLVVGLSAGDSAKVFRQVHRHETSIPGPQVQFATMRLANGKSRRVEFYYGSGYLSQSSRVLELPAGADSVSVVDFSGKH